MIAKSDCVFVVIPLTLKPNRNLSDNIHSHATARYITNRRMAVVVDVAVAVVVVQRTNRA